MAKARCHNCHSLLMDWDGSDCPVCGESKELLEKACDLDHACTCGEAMFDTVTFCSVCGKEICPKCGSHDVAVISRITGYLQELKGWNQGKRQEFKDRHRTDLGL